MATSAITDLSQAYIDLDRVYKRSINSADISHRSSHPTYSFQVCSRITDSPKSLDSHFASLVSKARQICNRIENPVLALGFQTLIARGFWSMKTNNSIAWVVSKSVDSLTSALENVSEKPITVANLNKDIQAADICGDICIGASTILSRPGGDSTPIHLQISTTCSFAPSSWLIDRANAFGTASAIAHSNHCLRLDFRPLVQRSFQEWVFEFAQEGFIYGLQVLFERGEAAPWDVDQEDWTLLHLACQQGYLNVAKFLINHGCPAASIASAGTERNNYDVFTPAAMLYIGLFDTETAWEWLELFIDHLCFEEDGEGWLVLFDLYRNPSVDLSQVAKFIANRNDDFLKPVNSSPGIYVQAMTSFAWWEDSNNERELAKVSKVPLPTPAGIIDVFDRLIFSNGGVELAAGWIEHLAIKQGLNVHAMHEGETITSMALRNAPAFVFWSRVVENLRRSFEKEAEDFLLEFVTKEITDCEYPFGSDHKILRSALAGLLGNADYLESLFVEESRELDCCMCAKPQQLETAFQPQWDVLLHYTMKCGIDPSEFRAGLYPHWWFSEASTTDDLSLYKIAKSETSGRFTSAEDYFTPSGTSKALWRKTMLGFLHRHFQWFDVQCPEQDIFCPGCLFAIEWQILLEEASWAASIVKPGTLSLPDIEKSRPEDTLIVDKLGIKLTPEVTYLMAHPLVRARHDFPFTQHADNQEEIETDEENAAEELEQQHEKMEYEQNDGNPGEYDETVEGDDEDEDEDEDYEPSGSETESDEYDSDEDWEAEEWATGGGRHQVAISDVAIEPENMATFKLPIRLRDTSSLVKDRNEDEPLSQQSEDIHEHHKEEAEEETEEDEEDEDSYEDSMGTISMADLMHVESLARQAGFGAPWKI